MYSNLINYLEENGFKVIDNDKKLKEFKVVKLNNDIVIYLDFWTDLDKNINARVSFKSLYHNIDVFYYIGEWTNHVFNLISRKLLWGDENKIIEFFENGNLDKILSVNTYSSLLNAYREMYGVRTCFSEPIYEQTNKVISTEDIIIINFLLKKYDLVSKGLELRHHLNNIVIDEMIKERDAILNHDKSHRIFNTALYKRSKAIHTAIGYIPIKDHEFIKRYIDVLNKTLEELLEQNKKIEIYMDYLLKNEYDKIMNTLEERKRKNIEKYNLY